MVHMHKQLGLFIPDVEHLKHPEGLLTYVELKFRRDYICLYCNDHCQPFVLEALRKHMEAKSHCKLRYGDDNDEEGAELEVFYDYSSSSIELGSGSELVITRKIENGQSNSWGITPKSHDLPPTEIWQLQFRWHQGIKS